MVHKIGLGTVQFGIDYGISNQTGITGIDEVKIILNLAREAGVDLIDTAYCYGKSQEVLGLAGIQGFKIVSKFLPESNGISLKEQLRMSLERLKTEKLYGLLAHSPLDVLENPQTWEYLMDLKKKRTVEKIGFSFNNPEEAEMVLEKGFVSDLIQVPFNYLDNRFRNIMIFLKEKGCEIHSRSAFLQGLFFMSADELPMFFEEIKPILNEIQKKGRVLPGLLLKYCLDQNFIDKVIIGVNNHKQLKENIQKVTSIEVLPELNQKIKSKILTPSEWPYNE